MNERIKDLLNVCGLPNEDLMEIYSDPNRSFYMQQFADLIVKECCDWIDGAICSDEGMILLTKPFIISNLKNIFENKDVL